jgi:hypothetical protein
MLDLAVCIFIVTHNKVFGCFEIGSLAILTRIQNSSQIYRMKWKFRPSIITRETYTEDLMDLFLRLELNHRSEFA